MISKLRAKRGGVPAHSTEKAFLAYLLCYCQFFTFVKQHGFSSEYTQAAIKRIRKSTNILGPDEIIQERKQHWMSQDDDIRRQHEEAVTDFMNMLRQEKVRGKPASSGKVAYGLIAIRVFYDSNYRDLKGVPTPSIITETTYKVPTQEEMRDACEVAGEISKRLRTWILCDKDCGMSTSDLLKLTGNETSSYYGTIKKQLKTGTCPIHIHIMREKVKTTVGFFDTFIGEDGFEALEKMLKHKRKYRKIFNVGARMLEIEFNKLSVKMGWQNFVPKSCRKFFKSQLTFGQLNNAFVEYWMGHSLRKVEGAYLVERLRDHPEQQRGIYVEYYKCLKV